MNGTKKSDNDEVLYLNEINDEVSKPLTSGDAEAVPSVHLRAGFVADGDLVNNSRRPSLGGTETDEHDKKPSAQSIGFDSGDGPEFSGHPPGWSGFPDPALNTIITPDVNVYQHKKTLAQGMMDLALLSANANQMRYVLQTDERHPYFYPALVMISMSLFLQIAVGIGLIWNSIYNVKEHEEMCKANQANNWTVIGIFLVTVLNVFISSFGVVDQPVAVTA
ncbi:ninjurin-2 [Solenopsis invicta]|uniref:ninjurin-2 n=1 Tax=Solenopsis invicta TaxID=13686 RepID=UPI0005961490|nr:ninjurin-2 [Solenopsis invicta]XP_011157229.1 ninjurin-2 [Solenopsis invicta]